MITFILGAIGCAAGLWILEIALAAIERRIQRHRNIIKRLTEY